jgi:hypothetical protein
MAFIACKPELKLDSDFDIPQGKALASSNDLENALQSAYGILRSKDNFGGAWVLWPEIMADQVVYYEQTTIPCPELNIYNRVLQANDSLINYSWKNAYQSISLCNAVLKACESGNIKDGDFDRNKARFIGEARFLRALTYFHLIRFFSPQIEESNRGLAAIPMPLEYFDELNSQVKSSIGTVYDQIITDLKVSIEQLTAAGRVQNFPEEEFPLGQGLPVFNKASAHIARGYLAKVYAQIDSKRYAAEIISEINQVLEDRSQDSLDFTNHGPPDRPERYFPQPYPLFGISSTSLGGMYSQNFTRGYATTFGKVYELIFSIMNAGPVSESLNSFDYLSSRFSYRPSSNFFNRPVPFIPISTSNLVFGANPLTGRTNDKRFITFFGRESPHILVNNVRRDICYKYLSVAGFNVPLMRSADLLLLRAEARIQQGNLKGSIYDLGFVKFRALVNVDSIRNLYAAAREQNESYFWSRLISERRKELYLEGDRLHTLRRLKLDIPESERGPSIPWNSPDLIFPIPFNETSVNQKLK